MCMCLLDFCLCGVCLKTVGSVCVCVCVCACACVRAELAGTVHAEF